MQNMRICSARIPRVVRPDYLSDGPKANAQLDLLTFSVQKALKVLYFDGSSAAKSPRGHLDTQDLLLWGRTRPDKLWNEDERIKMLCDWGFEMGIDGYLRCVRLLFPKGIADNSMVECSQVCK